MTADDVFLLPVSFAQQRLWLLAQMEPSGASYNIANAFRLAGPLSAGALRRAVERLVHRHETLRTTFAVVDGEPMQVIAAQPRVRLPEVDLRRLPAEARGGEEYRLSVAEARRPFDLAVGPLFRPALVHLEDHRHLLFATLHHLVTDGWSESVLASDLAALYRSEAEGVDSGLADLPVQYGDYSQWQREVLQGEVYDELVSWWTKYLEGYADDLELPADRPRPAEPGRRGATVTFEVDPAVAEALDALARAEGVTPFVVLLAAFAILLCRHAGRREVVIGTPVANRPQVELKGLIGLFLNTLPLRVDLAGDPSFRALLGRLREVVLAAQEHQDLPFERLVAELHPRRDRSRSPFFQVLFNLESTPPKRALRVSGVELEPVQIDTRSAKLDLMLNLQRSPQALRGSVELSTDLFDGATVRRWIERFQVLLAAAAAQPDRPVGDLPLLTGDDLRHRAVAGSAAAVAPPPGPFVPVHRAVLAVAERCPDAVAVRCGDAVWSFAELAARTHDLTARLRAAGVGAETRVAIHLDRGPHLLPAILAVLAAGGAFVPLDPTHPRRRIEEVLADAAPAVVIATRGGGEAVAAAGLPVIEPEPATPARPAPAPGSAASPLGAAYVIYTSGSTGRPKGVLVSHGALATYLGWALRTYPLDAHGALVHGSPAVDMTITSLLLPLLAGRAVELLPADAGPEELAPAIAGAAGFGFLKLTPTHLELLSRTLPPDAAGKVGALVVGGEALRGEQLEHWRRHAPQVVLYNEYGPTETTVACALHRLGDADTAGAVPIGGSTPGSRLLLLDHRLAPVPPGAPGQVAVGGAQLARGYLSRPGETAARFVPDPFSGEPGARLYRTGDLARQRPDGLVVYLGRADQQLKVRGYRVEPAEVEAALLEHPGVEAAVVVGDTAGGDVRLAAYLVGPEVPTPEALREHLLRRVPEALVPTLYRVLDALPLTAAGKLDRRALPPIDAPRSDAERVVPRTSAEEALASIWSSVLGVDEVGVTESFFSLGGDSIRSLRVVALARDRGLALTMRLLNEHPTIAELAEHLGTAGETEEVWRPTRPFELIADEDRRRMPDGVEDAYPLARMQAGMLYHRERMPGAPLFHSINSHHLRMPFDEGLFCEAVLAAARRHPNLRTSFDLTSFEEPLQLVHAEARFPVVVHDLRHLSDGEQHEVLREHWRREQRRPFDLSRPPQLRFILHRRSDDSVQFTLTENHAIIDGWSLHLVLGEILEDYFSRLETGRPAEPPPLTTTFRDFVALERAAMASAEQREFWDRRLAGYEPIRLPLRAGGEVRDGARVRRLDRLLPPPLMRRLLALARDEAVPLKSLLLAAHVRVLGLLAGCRDVVTGLSANGRLESLDGERVAGLFLNTLPVRVHLDGGSWRQLVRRLHQAELEHGPYRRYPLAEMQARWGSEPIFDTSFVYLNFHVIGDQLDAGRLEYLETGEMVEETNFTIMTAFQHQPGHRSRVALSLCCDRWKLGDARIEAIAGYYLAALRALARNPDAAYDLTDLLAQDERRRLLATWAEAAPAEVPPPGGELPTVLHRFEAGAARHPDRPCLGAAGAEWTYAEVDARAGRLARRLRRCGVGPETVVALLAERSPEAVIGLLAVWKAGGACLPLDPSHPDGHLRAVVAGAAPVAALASESQAERLAERLPTVVLSAALAGAEEAEEAEAGQGEPRRPAPEHLAYVVYTSGSSGAPKGVAVEHRQLAAYVEGVMARLELPPDGRYALVSTLAADLGYTMVFPALAAGGFLDVVADDAVRDAAAMAGRFAAAPPDCLKVVPGHLAALLAAAGAGAADLLPRQRLVLGGEAAEWRLVERLRELAPECRIFNHYGPTETTVGVLAGEIGAGEEAPRPPLGRPFGAARAYVLDRRLLPVPAGVSGELVIAGATLARGYLGDPRQTAARFVPDPHAGAAGRRMYRTGDAARHLDDGRFEFLGRVDRQVKIRGQRVEPEQVEAVLRLHPGLDEACVVATGDGGETRLTAFVVAAASGGGPDDEEVRRHLAARLPAAMVPSSVRRLERLPRTANGKIDRSALAGPERGVAGAAERPRVPPRNEVERRLVEIWKGVLAVDELGVLDDLFELGADSIKGILAVARMRKAFSVDLPVDALFAGRTVATLARHVDEARAADGAAAAPPLVPVPRDRDLPLSDAQRRMWYVDLLDPGTVAYNVPHAFLLRGALDVAAWRRSLAAVVQRHEVLRTRFPTVDGEPRQVIEHHLDLRVPGVDLAGLPRSRARSELRRLARAEAWRGFDLARGPLIRCRLVRVHGEEHGVLLTLHHIVFDGWSSAPWCATWPPTTGPAGAAANRICRPCPCNTRTTRCGRASAWAAASSTASSPTGASASPVRRRSPCPPTGHGRRVRVTAAAGSAWPSTPGRRCVSPRSPAGRGERRSWSCCRRTPPFSATAPVRARWWSGCRRRPTASGRSWRSSSASSSTRCRCASTWRATRRSASCCAGCAVGPPRRSPTRTCPSRSWSTSSSRSGTSAAARCSRSGSTTPRPTPRRRTSPISPSLPSTSRSRRSSSTCGCPPSRWATGSSPRWATAPTSSTAPRWRRCWRTSRRWSPPRPSGPRRPCGSSSSRSTRCAGGEARRSAHSVPRAAPRVCAPARGAASSSNSPASLPAQERPHEQAHPRKDRPRRPHPRLVGGSVGGARQAAAAGPRRPAGDPLQRPDGRPGALGSRQPGPDRGARGRPRRAVAARFRRPRPRPPAALRRSGGRRAPRVHLPLDAAHPGGRPRVHLHRVPGGPDDSDAQRERLLAKLAVAAVLLQREGRRGGWAHAAGRQSPGLPGGSPGGPPALRGVGGDVRPQLRRGGGPAVVGRFPDVRPRRGGALL